MKRNNIILFVNTFILAGLGGAAGFAAANGKYWTLLMMTGLLLVVLYCIKLILTKNISQTIRVIDGIRYCETNISFVDIPRKGMDSELTLKMQGAISRFNERIEKMRTDVSFFEMLLGRVDLALIVVDEDNNVLWSNNATLEVLNQFRPTHLSELAILAPGLPEIISAMRPQDVRTIKIQRSQQEFELAINMAQAHLRGVPLKIFSFKNIDTIVERTEDGAWIKLIKILTHEIMNSISPIVSLAETFGEESDNDDPDMIKRAMVTIRRRSEGLMQFVDDYRKLTPSGLPVKSEFPLEDLFDDTARLTKPKGINFSYNIYPSGLCVNADKGKLEQVLINLINNAWEAAAPNEEPKIEITARIGETGRVRISVKDNGGGITSEAVDKIFIPFYTTKKQGSGIGLSICRQIITSHGGSISVSRNPDKGSTFTIIL